MSRSLLPSQDALGLPSQGPEGNSSNPNPQDLTGPPPPQDNRPSYAKRGKITIVACVPCRRRKTKCDGKRPSCSQCESRDGTCSYDMTDDQRKLTYLRDNVEQLQEKSSSLESLLGTIQTASDEEAAELFRRLRSGVDVQMIAELVQAGHLLSGVGRNPPIRAATSALPAGQISAPVHVQARLQQYDFLMNTIVDSSPTTSLDIVRRIRRRESLETILNDASAGRLDPQPLFGSSSTQSLEGKFESQEQRFGMMKGEDVHATHAAANVRSEFLVSVTPKQSWTSVTKDLELIEHLVNLYFTWQHCFFQSFPEKLFRSDMAEGRTKYCSAMLVNAICAAGCFFSSRKQVTEDRGDGYDLKVSFYEEAVNLLGQNPRPTVPTTATLYLLSYVEGTRGDLSSLWTFSGRSSLMALDLNLHLRRNKRPSDEDMEHDELRNEERARTHAFWGSFHADQTTCFTLGRLPMLNRNGITVELPGADDEDDNDPWEAYEINLPHRPGARSSTFKFCATLSNVVNSTLMMFFAPTVPLSGSLLLEEYDKYLNWYQSLPSILSPSGDAPPHVLCLHMYYHSAVLLLFRPFLKATLHDSDVLPREVCRSAANSISNLWEEHHKSYKLAGIYMFQVHCLLTACTIHIINLPTISSTKHFTRACEYFQELIPRNEWARSSLHILRNLVQKWGLILPIEAEGALYRDDSMHPQQAPLAARNQPAPQPTPGMMNWRRDSYRDEPPIDPQISNMRPESPSQFATSRSSPQTQSAPKRTSAEATRHAMRSPSGTDSQSSETSQKRQRLRSPTQRLRNRNSTAPSSDSSFSQRHSVSNYLYSPLADQPVPLLVPVHPQSGSAMSMTAHPTSTQEDEEVLEPRKASGIDQDQQQEQQRGRPDSSSSTKLRRSERSKRSGSEVHGIQHGVEGLSFGDDWRDPFMGYLGGGEA